MKVDLREIYGARRARSGESNIYAGCVDGCAAILDCRTSQSPLVSLTIRGCS